MLTEDEFDSWKSRLNLPEYSLTILEQVRSSDPSRPVQGGRSNVCGNYPSQKMGVSIQFESHRDELSHIVEKLEHGSDVLEYYDQPPPIELLYLSKKGKPVRCLHTPDFFVIRSNSAGWEECKTQEELVKLAKEKPNRYVQDEEGCWRCPPGSEYASKFGLYYCLRSSAETNPVRLRNFTWLEPYFCEKSFPGNEAEKKALLSLVEALPGITFAELLLEADWATPDDINILIATEQVYVNLSAAPLTEPDQVRVFLNQEIALAYEQITKTLPSTVAPSFPILTVDVGISLSWDGEYWEILNTGTQKIALQKTDGKVINLSNSDEDAKAFKSVLQTFQSYLPLEEEPDLVQHWEYCYAHSVGCVGVLKDWLSQTLSAVLNENEQASTITLKNLERHAQSVRKCLLMLKTAQKGEAKLTETTEEVEQLYAALGFFRKSQKPECVGVDKGGEQQHNTTNSGRKRGSVGQPNPKRYEVGGC